MSDAVLRVNDLIVEYYTDAGIVRAANKINFELKAGERLGLVGESGSGKSTTVLGILRMIKPPGRVFGGSVMLDGTDLLSLADDDMRQMRGSNISMIPQGAMNSLNPVMRVDDQLLDLMSDHGMSASKAEKKEIVAKALQAVDLDPRVGQMYPHELSGGMKQRVCIAISIVMSPKVIIADEPTSALDVVTQRQVMQTIGKIQDEMGSAVILIGHDMGLMCQFVDRIAVMYAGRLMELGSVNDIFTDALHPYTQALIDSLPVLENKGQFQGLSGITPSLLDLPSGCVFHTRCAKAMPSCSEIEPDLREHVSNRWAACLLYEDQAMENVAVGQPQSA